jgi:hypothetical protein
MSLGHCSTTSNPSELTLYTQWENETERYQQKKQQTENKSKRIQKKDDEWIIYPPTAITVGCPVTVVKRRITIFSDTPTHPYDKNGD